MTSDDLSYIYSYSLNFSFTDDKKWWEKPIPPGDAKNIWYTKPNSVNIEMTSYALLAILQAGLYTNALPIVKWLVNQRNELGGFQSTQDTFIGLKALSRFAETSSSDYNNVQITYKYGEGGEKAESNLGVNGNNALIQQTYDVSTVHIRYCPPFLIDSNISREIFLMS